MRQYSIYISRFFILFCVLSICLSPVHASDRTIVFLGDSLTAGYGLEEESAFPALIQKKLDQKNLSWKVVNAGISGDTSKGGLKRLNWVLRSKPDVVFVALGVNDGLRGLDIKNTLSNLETIILQLKKADVTVLLGGMKLPYNYGETYRKKFEKMFKRLAKKHRLRIYPFLLKGVATDPKLNLTDGVHPNEQGHEVIAENLYRFLVPVLKGMQK